jgi:outer membrane cobalamin receptor
LRIWLPFLLVVLLALPCAVAAGEDEDDTDAPVFTPGEIVVTGKRSPAERTATTQEITAEDIKALGATNVAEALQLATGLRVDSAPSALSSNGKQESLASLRGFDARSVIVLIDGIPVYEPYFRVLDLRQIPVGDVAKIKIIKGPTSVLYGPNALAGVINITTKRGSGPPRGHVDVGYGDVETYRAGASASGGVGEFDYFLAPGYAKTDGFPVSGDFTATRNEDGGLRTNSDFVDYYANGKVGWQRGLHGLSLSAGHYAFEGGVPFSMEAVEPGTLWRKFWRKTSIAAYGETAPVDFLLLRGKAFYTRFYNTIESYTDVTMSAVADAGDGVSTYDNDVFGYQVLPEFILGRFGTITLSNLYKQDRVHIQDERGGQWFDFGAETVSGGAEYGVPVADFSFVAGAAYNFYRRVETPTDDLGEDDAAIDYQAGLAYAPLAQLSFHAAGARKTAFPDLRSLYGSQGNPDLDSESAYNVDAGFDARPIPALGLSSTWFYSQIDELIGKKEMGNEFTYENIDEARITGVESAVDTRLFGRWLFLRAAHTWLQTRDLRESRRLERLDFRPEHTASFDGRLHAPFGLSLSAQFLYVGERQYEQPSAARETRALPPYGVTSARLAQRVAWDAGRTSAEFFVEGKNLFDVYHEAAPEKPSPGRSLFGGVSLDF